MPWLVLVAELNEALQVLDTVPPVTVTEVVVAAVTGAVELVRDPGFQEAVPQLKPLIAELLTAVPNLKPFVKIG